MSFEACGEGFRSQVAPLHQVEPHAQEGGASSRRASHLLQVLAASAMESRKGGCVEIGSAGEHQPRSRDPVRRFEIDVVEGSLGDPHVRGFAGCRFRKLTPPPTDRSRKHRVR
jgi:hypothetical protein